MQNTLIYKTMNKKSVVSARGKQYFGLKNKRKLYEVITCEPGSEDRQDLKKVIQNNTRWKNP